MRNALLLQVGIALMLSGMVGCQPPPTPEPELSDQEKNALWWEMEAVSPTVNRLVVERDETDAAGVDRVSRELREPIAERFGISYEHAMGIYDQGMRARWRTPEPPGKETPQEY